MIALERMADALSELRSVQIDPRRCLPCRSPRANCSSCAGICPEGAISLGRSPAVAECSTCGLCAAACQADAIRLDNPSDQTLLQRFARLARTERRLRLTCSRRAPQPTGDGAPIVNLRDAPDAIAISCLARLTPELLLAAAACGFDEILLLEPADCGACTRSAGMVRLRQAMAAAQSVLDGLGHPCRIRLQPAAASQPMQASVCNATPSSAALPLGGGPRRGAAPPVHAERRAFLLSALGLLRQALPAAPRQAEPGLLTPSTSRRREILLWALGELAHETVPESLTWGEAAPQLTAACHRCSVCVRLCPNGALALDEAGLHLNPQQCHACGLCTQVCPTSSLTMGPPRPLHLLQTAEPLTLGSPQPTRCTLCGAEEQAVLPNGLVEQTTCLPCALRRRPAQAQKPTSLLEVTGL